MNEHDAIIKAIKVLGGQTNAAKLISKSMGVRVASNTISDWINKHNRCPEKYAFHIQHLTQIKGDTVKAFQLCPVAFSILKTIRKNKAA
jgi:hypothetical protein